MRLPSKRFRGRLRGSQDWEAVHHGCLPRTLTGALAGSTPQAGKTHTQVLLSPWSALKPFLKALPLERGAPNPATEVSSPAALYDP